MSASDDATPHTTSEVEPGLGRWQRSLLPAILGTTNVQRHGGGGVTVQRSARDWAVDLALFAWALLAGERGAIADYRTGKGSLLAVGIALGLLACGALWVRRRYPLQVALLCTGSIVVTMAASGAAVVALFTLAIYGRQRRVLQLAAALPVAALFYELLRGVNVRDALILFGVVSVASLFIVFSGAFVRIRRELVLSLREQARSLRAAQQLQIHEAQLAERSRIAREMHDVLSHRISLLSLYAGALEFNANASPEEVAQAAAVIRESARAIQEDLRAIIGVLRFADQESSAGGDSTFNAEVAPPQPTLADLDVLAAESRGAGMDLNLACEIEAGSLSSTTQRTIYRIVQEGLTNARKHALGQAVSVRIGLDGESDPKVRVTVENRPAATVGGGPTGPAGPAGPVEQSAPPAPLGVGVGLIGLRERVALASGVLHSQRLPGGGFLLQVTLPYRTGPSAHSTASTTVEDADVLRPAGTTTCDQQPAVGG